MWHRLAAVGIALLVLAGVWLIFALQRHAPAPTAQTPPAGPWATWPAASQPAATETNLLQLPVVQANEPLTNALQVPLVQAPAVAGDTVETAAAVAAGLDFLRGQFRPEAGLLQESPHIGALRFYIANDNLLARYVFEALGSGEDEALVQTLAATMAQYPEVSDDFVRVAWGRPLAWPLYHHEDVVVAQLADGQCDAYDDDLGVDATGEPSPDQGPCIFVEQHNPAAGHFYDWSSYANLTFMQVISLLAQGRKEAAETLYQMKLVDFNARGFADKPYWEYRGSDGQPLHLYETLGLAWGVYAAALLGDRSTTAAQMVARLLAQQDPAGGGFHTHFSDTQDRLVDPNVETTSVALLALATWAGDHIPRQMQGRGR